MENVESMRKYVRDRGISDCSNKELENCFNVLKQSEKMANTYRNEKKQMSCGINNYVEDKRNSPKQNISQKQNKQKKTKGPNKQWIWRMNPLKCPGDENDVALSQTNRVMVEESTPFDLCKKADTVSKRTATMNMINDYLENVSCLWYKRYSIAQTKFEWVKVDLTETKKHTVDYMNIKVENKDKNDHEQISKRKSVNIWAQLFDSSSDESDENSANPEKRLKIEDTSNLLHCKKQELTENIPMQEEQSKEISLPAPNGDDEDTNNTNIKNVNHYKTQTKKVIEESHKESEITKKYPQTFFDSKAIEAANLQKNVLKAGEQFHLSSTKNYREKDSNEEGMSTSFENKNYGLIKGEMDKSDRILNLEKNDNEDKVSKKDIVIKPLPLSARITKQCEILRQIDAENKKMLLAEKEKNWRKEEVEKEQRRQEFNKRRKQELEDEFKQQEKIKQNEQKKEKWLYLLQSRSKIQGTECKEEDKKRLEERKEDMFKHRDNIYEFGEMENEIDYLKEKVTCPICKKPFASDEIENHAAACEQFEVDYEEEEEENYVNPKTSVTYECSICLSFKTDNVIDYEDHINVCIQHKQNTSSQGSITTTMNATNSSIHSTKPISQQNSTDIIYIGQWHSSDNVSKKRKH